MKNIIIELLNLSLEKSKLNLTELNKNINGKPSTLKEKEFTLNNDIKITYDKLYKYASDLVLNNDTSNKTLYNGYKSGLSNDGILFGVIYFPFMKDMELIPVGFDVEVTKDKIKLLKFIS